MDDAARWIIRSKSAARIPRDGGIEFYEVTIEETRRGRRRTARAPRAVLEIKRGDTIAQCRFQIEAHNAHLTVDNQTVERTKTSFGPLDIAPEWIAPLEKMSDDMLLNTVADQSVRDPLTEQKLAAVDIRSGTVRRILSTLSERAAFSVSVFVLVILGAALGIVFRGSHAVVAFGISFIPSLLAIITIVMGKQMAQNASTQGMGFLVMWSGIAVVAGLDCWTLTKVLRR